jgi:hypothetical protein
MARDPGSSIPATNHDEAVRARYGAAANQRESALCCPVDSTRTVSGPALAIPGR